MPSTPLITTMAAALGLALVLGMAAVKLRLPALVSAWHGPTAQEGDAARPLGVVLGQTLLAVGAFLGLMLLGGEAPRAPGLVAGVRDRVA